MNSGDPKLSNRAPFPSPKKCVYGTVISAQWQCTAQYAHQQCWQCQQAEATSHGLLLYCSQINLSELVLRKLLIISILLYTGTNQVYTLSQHLLKSYNMDCTHQYTVQQTDLDKTTLSCMANTTLIPEITSHHANLAKDLCWLHHNVLHVQNFT